jgi:NAD-dependent dihydropyrimidine dehydrogenase PreA subunit
MEIEDQIYYQLRKEMDERMPVGFPSTESGTEIDILKKLFNPEEAQIAVHLSALPEPVEKIHKRLTKHGIDITVKELDNKLRDMYLRGIIFGGELYPKPNHYSLAQWLIGIIELQVDALDKEIVIKNKSYGREAFYNELYRKDGLGQSRIIPVEQSLNKEHHIATYDNIREIIEQKEGPIALIDCICRQSNDILGNSCKLTNIRNNCMAFGVAAKVVLELNKPSAREVSKDELLELLDDYQKVGFILTPENAKNPAFICSCCGCCCNFLDMLKQLPRPSEYVNSNFYANVIPDNCIGCGECMEICQMDAITLKETISNVNLDFCIGCGNCVAHCKNNGIILKEKKNLHVPPKDRDKLYQKVLMNKKGLLGTISMLGKRIIGKKV